MGKAKRMRLDDFSFLKPLGKGTYGVVHKVRSKVDGNYYVIKEQDFEDLSEEEQQDLVNEARLLAQVEDQHVVRLYDVFMAKGKMFMVMELCSKGNLYDYMMARRGRPIPEDSVWRFFLQTLLGLHAIHRRNILHRDLKLLNIFLTEHYGVKIGDFGIAKKVQQGSFTSTFVGTPYYLPPELITGRPYDAKADLWSLGCLLYELLTQNPPFNAENQGALFLKITEGRYAPVTGYTAALIRVVDELLCTDPDRRPSTQDLLQRRDIRLKLRQYGLVKRQAGDEPRPEAPPERSLQDRRRAHISQSFPGSIQQAAQAQAQAQAQARAAQAHSQAQARHRLTIHAASPPQPQHVVFAPPSPLASHVHSIFPQQQAHHQVASPLPGHIVRVELPNSPLGAFVDQRFGHSVVW